MSNEAHITSIWKKQKGFLALFFAVIALWFLFDAKTGFPQSNERWLAYEKLKTAEHLSEWPALAKEKGWNEIPPHKLYKKADILAQYVVAILLFIASLGAFLYWLSQIKQVYTLKPDAVILPNRKRIPFSSITRINQKQWESKGLATVYFSIDGRQGKFVLDDYKFDREAIHEIMKAMVSNRPTF